MKPYCCYCRRHVVDAALRERQRLGVTTPLGKHVRQADLAGWQSLPQPLLGVGIGVEKKRLHLVGVDEVAESQVLAEVAHVALHGLRLETEAVLVASREQRRSRRRADGGGGEGAEELHPVPRQGVDVGGVRGGVAVRGQVVSPQIVGDD